MSASLRIPALESRTEQILVRGLRYNIRHWGAEDAPALFLLHGWMDSSPTFQFVVDALRKSWHVIAPDWRGYGHSQWLSTSYWFPDYYADLDELLAHYSPHQSVRLVGHSMGANIASVYAGIRPERVAKLVMLDFLGLKPGRDVDFATQTSSWLAEIQQSPKLNAYQDHAALARRLRSVNPRLTAERADFLSRHVSRLRPDGQVEMACDPWHKNPLPTHYRAEDSMACWRRIEASVLLLVADHGFVHKRLGEDPAEYERRTGVFRQLQVESITDSGHNVQHDQPGQVAAALEGFLGHV